MKPLILINNSFVSKYEHTSGGDERFLTFINDLVKLKIDFELYSCLPFSVKIQEKNLKINNFPQRLENTNIYVYYFLRIIWLSLKLLKHRNQIIISASDQLPDVIPCLFNKLIHKRIKIYIMSYHLIPNPFKRNGKFINNILSYYSQYIFKKNFKRIQTVIVPTKIYANKLKKFGFNTEILPMKIKKIELDKEISRDLDIIYVGRIAPNKGLNLIPQIFQNLKSSNKLNLYIIGSGETKYVDLINVELKPYFKQMYFLGYLSDLDKINYMLRAKCLILPSLEEGFSLTILEALSCGAKVVAWEISELREIYGDQIFYSPIGDYENFANNIETIINNKNFEFLPSNQSIYDEESENKFFKSLKSEFLKI